ncbi:MAG: hypothetical protein AAGB34_04935 [Planctomycetota bacterium]
MNDTVAPGSWLGQFQIDDGAGGTTTLSGPNYGATLASTDLGGGAAGEIPFRVWRADSIPTDDANFESLSALLFNAGVTETVISFQGPIKFAAGTETDSVANGGSTNASTRPFIVTRQRLDFNLNPIGTPEDITLDLDFQIVGGRTVEVGPTSVLGEARFEYRFFFNNTSNGFAADRILCDVNTLTADTPVDKVFASGQPDYRYTVDPADFYQTPVNTTATLPLPPDATTIVSIWPPANGFVTVSSSDLFYTPNFAFAGDDYFTVDYFDSSSNFLTAEYNVRVY